jgi:hypothetical protein
MSFSFLSRAGDPLRVLPLLLRFNEERLAEEVSGH